MPSFIRGPKDFWAGLAYIVLGAFFVWFATDYSMGTTIRMGPGYFPTVLGALLSMVGALSLARGLRRPGEGLSPMAWRPIMLISLALAAFAALLTTAGLIIALTAMLLISPAASRYVRYSFSGTIAGVGLIVFCALVFVKALGLPLPLIGTWFS